MSQYPTPYRQPDSAGQPYDPPADPWVGNVGEDEGGIELDRYLAAIRRYKILILVCVALGLITGFFVHRSIAPSYAAEGSVWVTQEARQGQIGPIRPDELLDSQSWIELLQSFAVLEPVVLERKLYLSHPSSEADLFAGFDLQDAPDDVPVHRSISVDYRPGLYRVHATDDGSGLVLTTDEGVEMDRAPLGEPLGEELGFDWRPSVLPSSTEPVPFTVRPLRAAAQGLRGSLTPNMDRRGMFINIQMRGGNPVYVANTLDAVFERFIEVAARLKRGRLDETNRILEEQRDSAQAALERAETALQQFRVNTATLPSDQSAPIASGLRETQGRVMGDYFGMRVDREQLGSEIERLEVALEPDPAGDVRLQALEVIPAVNQSSEMQSALSDIARLRAELRGLGEIYTDEYGPVAELLAELETLQQQVVPALGDQLLANLRARSDEIDSRLESREGELQEIPVRTITEARLQRDVDIADNIFRQISQDVKVANLAARSATPDVRILDYPKVPDRPLTDERTQWTLLSVLGFIGLGLVGAIVLDRLDRRLRYPTEVSEDLGLRILGVIPRIRVGRKGNVSQVREAFRGLRLHVEYAYGSGSPLTLAVTSPTEEEGKTTVAANLAMAFAGLGRHTLLIDGDTRRGDLHALLGCDRKPGLTDYLKGDGNVIQQTNQANLSLIGSGSRDSRSPDMLSSNRMLSLAAASKKQFDVIIFDCPPLMAGGDAFVLGAHAGNVLMVVRSGSSRKDLIAAKLDDFLRLPVRILGAVLNDASPKNSFGAYAYYADYLPGYEAQDEDEAVTEPIRADRILTGDRG